MAPPKPALRMVPRVETHEDVFESLTTWLRGSTTRTQQIEVTEFGLTCKLHEAGQLQATGRGRHADVAIANALEALQ